MTHIDPKFKQLIMDTTAEVMRETGLDRKPFEDLPPEEVDMLCERMGYEIKAKMTHFFAGLNSSELRERFNVIDESVKDVKREFDRERKGK